MTKFDVNTCLSAVEKDAQIKISEQDKNLHLKLYVNNFVNPLKFVGLPARLLALAGPPSMNNATP